MECSRCRPSHMQLWVGTTVIRTCLVLLLLFFAFWLCRAFSGVEFEHNGKSCAVLNYTIGVEPELVLGGGTLLDINLGSYNFTFWEIEKQFGNGAEQWCAGPFKAGTDGGFPVQGLIYMVSVWAALKLVLLARDFREAQTELFKDVDTPLCMTIYWMVNEYFVMTIFVSRLLGPFQSIVIAPGRPELMMIDLWEVPSFFCPYREGSLTDLDSILSCCYQVMILAQFFRCVEVWRKKRDRLRSGGSWTWHSPSLLIWPFPRCLTVRFLEWFKNRWPNVASWLVAWVPGKHKERTAYLVVKTMKLWLVIAVLYVPLLVHMMHFGFHFSWRLWFGASFRFTMSWPKFRISWMICTMQVLACILWLLETLNAVGVVLKMYRENKKHLAAALEMAKQTKDVAMEKIGVDV